jgi:hypothetical protein
MTRRSQTTPMAIQTRIQIHRRNFIPQSLAEPVCAATFDSMLYRDPPNISGRAGMGQELARNAVGAPGKAR